MFCIRQGLRRQSIHYRPGAKAVGEAGRMAKPYARDLPERSACP
jgi:hypothetical protein